MLKRNLLVKSALLAMPYMIDHEDKYEDVSMEHELRESIIDSDHWKRTAALYELLKSLCCAITHLEGDEATFSAVFACFLHIAHKIQIIDDDVLARLEVDRWNWSDVFIIGWARSIHPRTRWPSSPICSITTCASGWLNCILLSPSRWDRVHCSNSVAKHWCASPWTTWKCSTTRGKARTHVSGAQVEAVVDLGANGRQGFTASRQSPHPSTRQPRWSRWRRAEP